MPGRRPLRPIVVATAIAALGLAPAAPAQRWAREPVRAAAGGGGRQGPRVEDRRGADRWRARCGAPGGGAIIGAIAGGLLGGGASGYGDRGSGPIGGRGVDRDC